MTYKWSILIQFLSFTDFRRKRKQGKKKRKRNCEPSPSSLPTKRAGSLGLIIHLIRARAKPELVVTQNEPELSQPSSFRLGSFYQVSWKDKKSLEALWSPAQIRKAEITDHVTAESAAPFPAQAIWWPWFRGNLFPLVPRPLGPPPSLRSRRRSHREGSRPSLVTPRRLPTINK